ncbi:hypothetical protein [Streptomyces mirabilis]|uniref:hypothetical protein n=1 Tax=Streptomyces mirabilis TaxID=68239 RepID=UPI0033E25E5D
MGYIITGVKDVRQSKVGDTITTLNTAAHRLARGGGADATGRAGHQDHAHRGLPWHVPPLPYEVSSWAPCEVSWAPSPVRCPCM